SYLRAPLRIGSGRAREAAMARWRLISLLALLAAACAAAEAAQPPAAPPPPSSEPGHFKNLKFFPSDISKKDLMDQMHAMNDGLGVKCGYCHVMEPKKD